MLSLHCIYTSCILRCKDRIKNILSLHCLYGVGSMCMRECLYSVFTLKALHYLYSVKHVECVTLSLMNVMVFWFNLSVPSPNHRKQVLYGYALLTSTELVPYDNSNCTKRVCEGLFTRFHD